MPTRRHHLPPLSHHRGPGTPITRVQTCTKAGYEVNLRPCLAAHVPCLAKRCLALACLVVNHNLCSPTPPRSSLTKACDLGSTKGPCARTPQTAQECPAFSSSHLAILPARITELAGLTSPTWPTHPCQTITDLVASPCPAPTKRLHLEPALDHPTIVCLVDNALCPVDLTVAAALEC